MNKSKTILTTILIILATICLGVDVWWMFLKNTAPDKLTSNTVYAGLQEAQDGTSDCAFKVKLNKNTDKTGYEVFSLQFNYLTDEKSTSLYSQGMQFESNLADNLDWIDSTNWTDKFVDYLKKANLNNSNLGNDIASNFKFTTYLKGKTYKGSWHGSHYASYLNPGLTSGSVNYYQVNDGISSIATNPISNNSYFTVQTDPETKELVYLQFRGDDYATFNGSTITSDVPMLVEGRQKDNGNWFYTDYFYYYNNLSATYFANLLYRTAQSLPAGFNGYQTLEMDNIFNFYAVNSDKSVGTAIGQNDSEKVFNRIKSYLVVHFEIDDAGAKASEDTLFGMLQGSNSFKLDSYDNTQGNYFNGKSIIDVDVNDFELIEDNTQTNVYLKLKDNFIKTHLPYAKKIYLNISIDTSKLTSLGYIYSGFAKNSGLEYFNILKTEVI